MSADSAEKIYQGVAPGLLKPLFEIRKTHPYTYTLINGIRWEYVDTGSDRQPVLILGGGISTGESSFRRILQLKDQFRVISPSYPAVGDMAVVTDNLAALLNTLGIKRTHIYGHSLGAGVAHVFARRHQNKTDKLVLSGFGLYNQRTARLVISSLRLFQLLPFKIVQLIYQRKMARALTGISPEERSFLQAYTRDLLQLQHSKSTLMGQFRLLGDMVSNQEALEVQTPVDGKGKVLIIQADDDAGFLPEEQARLLDTYPGCQVQRFREGGHLAGITRRREFDHILIDFLVA